jgi:hypothetical protein
MAKGGEGSAPLSGHPHLRVPIWPKEREGRLPLAKGLAPFTASPGPERGAFGHVMAKGWSLRTGEGF